MTRVGCINARAFKLTTMIILRKLKNKILVFDQFTEMPN